MRKAIIQALVAVEGFLVVLLAGTIVYAVAGEGSTAGPVIGDHWHATYRIIICDEPQPHLAFWPGGVHTHDDGIIHIHPIEPQEEGKGATLAKWFEYGGGQLTQESIRLPGRNETWIDGEPCPEGENGHLRVLVNGEPINRWTDYIPRDSDSIVIIFGAGE
jgi:hypothetical protein